jgi:hypothetical protein
MPFFFNDLYIDQKDLKANVAKISHSLFAITIRYLIVVLDSKTPLIYTSQ